jgi:transcriptional regulator with XRE-family HTH domain
MDGKQIKEIRKNSGITQIQVTLATGISDTRLSQIEQGMVATEAETAKIEKFIREDVARRLQNLSSLLTKSSGLALAVNEPGNSGALSIEDASMRRTAEDQKVHDSFRKALEKPERFGGDHPLESRPKLR